MTGEASEGPKRRTSSDGAADVPEAADCDPGSDASAALTITAVFCVLAALSDTKTSFFG